jgi:hypothetical protein
MNHRDQITAEIENARAELADTVEGLVTRLDPKAGLHRTIQRAKDSPPIGLILAGVVTLGVVVVLRVRSH